MAGAVFGHQPPWGARARESRASCWRCVGLRGREHVPVVAMTYIDQKRVELARALASDPRVLLLDEWLAGLNPSELNIGIQLIESSAGRGAPSSWSSM